MRCAIIENGVVVNVAEADEEFAASQGWIIGDANVGDLWDGEKFTKPPQQPAPVPESVSPRQIRQALTRVGLRESVESFIASADQDTKDWYEFATEFLRNHQHVKEACSALGVTDSQADDLWRLAGSL